MEYLDFVKIRITTEKLIKRPKVISHPNLYSNNALCWYHALCKHSKTLAKSWLNSPHTAWLQDDYNSIRFERIDSSKTFKRFINTIRHIQ